MEQQHSVCLASRTGLILDFAAALGREVMVCGGEMWRVEEVLQNIFRVYDFEESSIYMELHTLVISARSRGEEPLLRQVTVGDINPELERLTRLTRLITRVCVERPNPESLDGMLRKALEGPVYPTWATTLGMVCALGSIDYIIGGSLQDGVMAVLGILIFLWSDSFFSSVPGTNHMMLRLSTAFLVGLLISAACRVGFLTQPYMAAIVAAFGLIPGIPLINACREVFCGRVLCGFSLFMQAFIETAIVITGMVLAMGALGVL